MSPNLSIKCNYPDLPVVCHREEFLDLLQKHQVVIVQADTGSGKSTQIPKFLLEAYLKNIQDALQKNVKAKVGKIGVTQPRRLAALSIAERLREELQDDSLVSSKIRFFEEGSLNAPVKVMTDGILLQEFKRDRLFKAYSAIMIDEAHERSLNIDILLGIFKSVLQARPEFRLVIASATMEASLFKDFYPNAAVLLAEGRTFPVDVEYFFNENSLEASEKNISGKGDSNLLEEAAQAILDLESRRRDALLCFLPSERDILDLSEMLEKELDSSFEVLRLYGRMSPVEQKKVFKKSIKTKIVLATNIAETSLTIPGIAYVVDSGLSRISRYNAQSRIQGLPIEKISQASARQRAGRAGRVKPGICIRLYDERDFNERDPYTEPEIRRSNLANVVLQLKSLGLDAEKFEFLQPPLRSAFRGSYRTLFELGAITSLDSYAQVTTFGREMSKLPTDVSLSAVLLRAKEFGALKAAVIVCAALSLQEVRITPQDEKEREKARVIHRTFGGHKSDFLTYIALWNAFCKEWDGSSWNKLRKFCDKNYLHFLRCREWIDLVSQYLKILGEKFETKECPFESFHADNLHMALLSGFLGGIAKKDAEAACFKLVSGRNAYVFPGSDCAKKTPDWILSAEVRETTRVFLTKNAEIKPEWILQVAEPFCTRRFFEPVWNKDRGFVEVVEEVSFKGFVISRGKRVDYARIDANDCAAIFFREAVVNMDMACPFDFMLYNEKTLEKLAAIEAKNRRSGYLPTESELVTRLLEKAPMVNSIRTLKNFILEHGDNALRFQVEDFITEDVSLEHKEKFVNHISFESVEGKLQQQKKHFGTVESFRLLGYVLQGTLVFDSKKSNDGLTLQIPGALLSKLSPAYFALEIDRWRLWILDAFLAHISKDVKNRQTIKERLDDAFCLVLMEHDDYSPIRALTEALTTIPALFGTFVSLNPGVDFHLNLHLEVLQKNGATLKVELSPEWGTYSYLNALRTLLPDVISDLPFGKFRYGSRGYGIFVMEQPEADFYSALFKKSILHAEFKDAVLDRLSFLETGGAHAAFCCPSTPKDIVCKALLSSEFNPLWTERFSGIGFAKGKRIRSFKELGFDLNSEDVLLKLGLIRLCYESALLGGKAFTCSWNMLKDVTLSMRHKKRISESVKRAAIAVTEAKSVYCILQIAVNLLHLDIVLPDSSPNPLETIEVRQVRNAFRPILQAKFLKEVERKELRDTLSLLESTTPDNPEFLERYLSCKLLFERLDALRMRRGIIEEEEKIEESALSKLKMQFGKLQ